MYKHTFDTVMNKAIQNNKDMQKLGKALMDAATENLKDLEQMQTEAQDVPNEQQLEEWIDAIYCATIDLEYFKQYILE